MALQVNHHIQSKHNKCILRYLALDSIHTEWQNICYLFWMHRIYFILHYKWMANTIPKCQKHIICRRNLECWTEIVCFLFLQHCRKLVGKEIKFTTQEKYLPNKKFPSEFSPETGEQKPILTLIGNKTTTMKWMDL